MDKDPLCVILGRVREINGQRETFTEVWPDLHGLKTKVAGGEFSLNTHRQIICIYGTKEVKQKVEEIVNEIAQASRDASTNITDGESKNQPLHENPIGRYSRNKGKNPKLKQGK